MVKGKTKSGFKFSVDEDVCNSYEFLENISQIQTGGTGFFQAVDDLLGKEQKSSLMDHCRNEKGIAPFDAVMTEVNEIIGIIREKNAETKN